MKFDTSNIKVGDKVCLVNCGINSSRVKHEDGYCRRGEGVISKIGRKYFYVTSGRREYKFNIEGGLDANDSCFYTYKIYKTFDEYKTEVDEERRHNQLREKYLTKDQYDLVTAIIEGHNG